MSKRKLKHSKKANITDESGATNVCIFIDGIPHIKFSKKKFIGVLSWYESKTDFRIEIYLKGATISNEYNSLEKWKSVLDIINDQV
jgi:hypothetical protein